MGCCKSKDVSVPQSVNGAKGQKPTQKQFGDYQNDSEHDEEAKRPNMPKQQPNGQPLQVIQHKQKAELGKSEDKEPNSSSTGVPKNNEPKDKKQASPLQSKKVEETANGKLDKSKDKLPKKEEPVQLRKLTKEEHATLVDFTIEKLTVISSKYEELARVLKGQDEPDKLEVVVESLREANKDIQNCLEDIQSMSFQDDKEIIAQINGDNKVIAKIHKERLKLVKGTIPFDDYARMILKLLTEIGALPQAENGDKKEVQDKKSEKGSSSKPQKDTGKKEQQSDKKFNESEFQDFDGFGFDKDTESEAEGGFKFEYETTSKKDKKDVNWNQKFDNWGEGSGQNKKSDKNKEILVNEEYPQEEVNIGEDAYHKPGEFDPHSKMMQNRMEVGQKVNKSFEAFANSRLNQNGTQNNKGSPDSREGENSVLKQSGLLERSTFIKNIIEKSIDDEAEKMRVIRYEAERDKAKQELEKMLNEFKKMKEELELMNEEHNNFKAEYDQAQTEAQRLREINSQFSQATEAILKKQMMFQEQKSILENKQKDIDSETQQMKLELINLKGFLMRNSYIYKNSNSLMAFVNNTVEKSLDKKDETAYKRNEPQFTDFASDSKTNKFASPDINKKLFMSPDVISADEIVANVLTNSRTTLEQSRKIREGGNMIAN